MFYRYLLINEKTFVLACMLIRMPVFYLFLYQ